MKYFLPMLIGVGLFIASIAAPLLVLLALPLIRWDAEESVDGMGRYPVVRGSLPKWLAFLETPDERLPGGLYEPAVLGIYNRWGRNACAWYWLGIRNTMHGLAAWFGTPVDKGWDDDGYGFHTMGDLWFLRYPLLGRKFAFKAGYRIYKVLDGTYIAIPTFTFTKA